MNRSVAVFKNLAAPYYKVVILAVLHKTFAAGDNSAVFTIVSILADAVELRCHLSVGAEVIGAGRQESVGLIGLNRSVAVFDNRATVHDIVIILADLDKSCVHRDFTVGIDIVHRAVRHRVHTKFGNALYKFAGCAVKFKDTFSQRSGILKNLNTVCQITVIVEIVSLAVNFIERHVPGVTRQIITRSVVITCALVVLVPSTLCHTGLVKLIRYAIDRIFTGHGSFGV